MFLKTFYFLFVFLMSAITVRSQTCTTLGQNPSTAFPVCGINTFSQSTVPYCGGQTVPGKCSANEGLSDTNPFWYRFTCFTAGTLGFVITPMDLADDYDWQIFDITGRNPDDVYIDASLFVACNWSGNTGLTGASAAGTSLINCAGPTYPTFSSMPTLKEGHQYLLLVSHFTKFTPSQLGYALEFKGGSASITDPKLPDLGSAATSCDASQLFILLNKKMKCASLAADGSDFVISSATTGIISAAGLSCTSSFDMDSLVLNLNNPLPPGDYTVSMKKGSDGNTLMDNCGREISEGRSLPFKVVTLLPTPMDSLVPVKCAPNVLQLYFKKKILCNTIAADGSNFVVLGPSAVSVKAAAGACSDGGSHIINITLANPVVRAGTYQIVLQPGSLGNTIIDECGQATPAGSSLFFTVKDTVSADFNFTLALGCKSDTINFTQGGLNGITDWKWKMADAGNSSLQNPAATYSDFGAKEISLIVSNGFCADTVSKSILLGNKLKAGFETNAIICPEDSAFFKNKSEGQVISNQWIFGNGNVGNLTSPQPEKYPLLGIEKIYPVQLIVRNGNCADTAVQKITVLSSCYIAVPNAFTPNGDGLNDFLYPVNAFKANHLQFKVYNRAGQLIYSSKEWTQKWDGTYKGEPQDSGMYVWTLSYTHQDTGKDFFLKGSTMLIR